MTYIRTLIAHLPALVLVLSSVACNTFHDFGDLPSSSSNNQTISPTNNATIDPTNNQTNGPTNNQTNGPTNNQTNQTNNQSVSESALTFPDTECFNHAEVWSDTEIASAHFRAVSSVQADIALLRIVGAATQSRVIRVQSDPLQAEITSDEEDFGDYKSWLINGMLHLVQIFCDTTFELRWTHDYEYDQTTFKTTSTFQCPVRANVALQDKGDETYSIWMDDGNLYSSKYERSTASISDISGLYGTVGSFAVVNSESGAYFWHPEEDVLHPIGPMDSMRATVLAVTHLSDDHYMTFQGATDQARLNVWRVTTESATLISTSFIDVDNPAAASFFRFEDGVVAISWTEISSEEDLVLKTLVLDDPCPASCRELSVLAAGVTSTPLEGDVHEFELQTAFTKTLGATSGATRLYALLSPSKPTQTSAFIFYAEWTSAQCGAP